MAENKLQMNVAKFFVSLTTLISLATVVMGHGRMCEPPARSTAYKYGFHTPPNANDHQLNCGGYWNQWGRNLGRCGICGDPYQGPRENEAGGKYGTGTIVRHYKEGQRINVELDITVGHGGWSEFRICPNNDVNKAATQQCLDQYLMATPSGHTRILHQHNVVGKLDIVLQLPQQLTCTQCVLQWRWNAATHNHCNYVTGANCCDGCGPQEQFYGCADVSIERSSNGRLDSTQRTTQRPKSLGDGFLPIDLK